MTPEDTVRGVAGPVGQLGAGWMFDPATAARGKELGLSSWAFYHCGRGGVLGDADASVLVAAFGFFPPELQRKAWDKGRSALPVARIVDEYAACCAAWGRRTFAEVSVAGRLADLLTTSAQAAEVMGVPLFAGWRARLLATDAPADAPARLALALQVMREHRGGLHLVAVAAQGVPPLQAVMSGRYGAGNAEFFGWPQPWPDPSVARDRMAEAERVTDLLVAPAYAALAPDSRAELVAGLRALPR